MEGDGGGGETERKAAEGVREAGEEAGWEAGFPRGREAGEIGKTMQHCAIFSNRIKGQAGRENIGREPGLKAQEAGR